MMQTLSEGTRKMSINIDKNIGDVMAAKKMINEVLEDVVGDVAPMGKTLKDFGGGYVECLKTKANVVLYFGFDSSKNRVSSKFEIEKEDILLWQEAIAESLWNVGGNVTKKRSFKKNSSGGSFEVKLNKEDI